MPLHQIKEDFRQSLLSAGRKVAAQSQGGGSDAALITSGLDAIKDALRLSDNLIFAQSTMKMLIEKVSDFEGTVREVTQAVGEVALTEINERLTAFRGAW